MRAGFLFWVYYEFGDEQNRQSGGLFRLVKSRLASAGF